jgi:hypothetical protein
MTFEDYLALAENRSRNRGERKGQAYYNALHDFRPELLDEVVGTYLDPFYNDAALGEFLTFVMVKW